MSGHFNTPQSRRDATEFLAAFLVEAIELQLTDGQRIDAALDRLLAQVVAQSLQDRDIESLLSDVHGDPRLRDRSQEFASRRHASEHADMQGDVASALHALGRGGKLTLLADHLGLRGAVDELATVLSIDETSKTRILYENPRSHAAAHGHPDLRSSGPAGYAAAAA
ncbi:MAG: hypothetical protein GAK30_02271 [Paracidovorax wautersii]|uniref:Uncharacterized protein n=1 Tax=Paracidovorax wautersii TaxID=1177982 RepID=A0A7V8FNC5_9BURK|nr:MAG: hypothetical protein GAK30_02271 [Paracidovorax wautersii]